MTRLKEWQLHEMRSRFERQWHFRKENFPCDPFSGQWIDGEFLPEWVLAVCMLAEQRLHHADRALKYQCYRKRGTAFNDCCVDRLWLASYLEECKRVEPEAHET